MVTNSTIRFKIPAKKEEVPCLEIEDRDDEEDIKDIPNQRETKTNKTYSVSDVNCPISFCAFKIKAKRSMQQPLILKHVEQRKSLAIDKCFPPHSRSKGFPCGLCYKEKLDVHLIQEIFSERRAYIVQMNSSYFYGDHV